MIGGAQPKVLLTQAEDGTLHLDELFTSVFGNPEEHKYKLVRQRDGLTKTSRDVKWLEFNEDGTYKGESTDIAVNTSLIMSPFNDFFTWQTTTVVSILESREGYTKFSTENSVYELFEI